MPTREFNFRDRTLLLRWPLRLTPVEVQLGSVTLGVIHTSKELWDGVSFTLEDGSQFTIKRKPSWGLVDIGVYYQDEPVQAKDPKPRVDPSKLAYGLGVFNLLIMLWTPFSSYLQGLTSSWFAALVALTFLLHGYFISRRAFFALLSLMFLYSTDTIAGVLSRMSEERLLPGIFLRLLFLRWMYSALPEKAKAKGIISLILSLFSGFGLWFYLNNPTPEGIQLPLLTTKHTTEVVVIQQKDPNDCGVATLQAMLAGYGIPTEYEKLRSRLKTDENGTNIDEMEDTAIEYGLEAYQIIVPPEHIWSPETDMLPAIVIVSNGLENHMLLLWEVEGDKIETLDPAEGKILLTPAALYQKLFIHKQAVSAKAYQEWACEGTFLSVLREQVLLLGISKEQSATLQQRACQSPDWNQISTLDAKMRWLVTSGQKNTPAEALALLSGPSSTPEIENYQFAMPAPADEKGDPQVYLYGAVLLVARGKK